MSDNTPPDHQLQCPKVSMQHAAGSSAAVPESLDEPLGDVAIVGQLAAHCKASFFPIGAGVSKLIVKVSGEHIDVEGPEFCAASGARKLLGAGATALMSTFAGCGS